MILWILALVILAGVMLVNYYQGAVRAAFSLSGLLAAALLAMPLSGLLKPVLRLAGLEHPVLLAFIAPALVWLLILVIFKIAGLTVHRKVDTHFKYHESETQYQLFQRLNQRLGIAVGLANGVVYVFILCAVLTTLGYFTTQVASAGRDSITLRLVNFLSQGVQASGMSQAVSPFTPKKDTYYDIADILGLIYCNPLIQSRLSTYPVFLTLAEKPEFQAIANDVQFQEFWQRQPPPTLGELASHEKIRPLIRNPELYKDMRARLGGDVADFKGYLETGKSVKYEDENLVSRWDFNYRESMMATRKTKPAWTIIELNRLRQVLGGTWLRAMLIATLDNQVIIKLGNGQAINGTWNREAGDHYLLRIPEAGKSSEVRATVEGRKLTFSRDGMTLVFDK